MPRASLRVESSILILGSAQNNLDIPQVQQLQERKKDNRATATSLEPIASYKP